MQKVEMQAAYRKESGKGPARQLRALGRIPAVLYKKGQSTSVVLNLKEMSLFLRSASSRNCLITLAMANGEEAQNQEKRLAVLKEIQHDPITEGILHVDLLEISMDEPIRVHVLVEIVGTAVGVKKGGILQSNLRDLEIQCLPSAIPDALRADVSMLEIGEAVHVRDILLGAGIKGITPPDRVVVSVVPPISETKMEAILASGPKETKEPEVVGRKEKEGEGKEDPKAKDAGKESKEKGKEPKEKGKK